MLPVAMRQPAMEIAIWCGWFARQEAQYFHNSDCICFRLPCAKELQNLRCGEVELFEIMLKISQARTIYFHGSSAPSCSGICNLVWLVCSRCCLASRARNTSTVAMRQTALGSAIWCGQFVTTLTVTMKRATLEIAICGTKCWRAVPRNTLQFILNY
jgi:hypothetical protein